MKQAWPPSCGLAAGGLLDIWSRRHDRRGACGQVHLRARGSGERHGRKQRIRACDIRTPRLICLDIRGRGQPLRLCPGASLLPSHPHRGQFRLTPLLGDRTFRRPPAAFHGEGGGRVVVDDRFVGLLKRLLRQRCIPPEDQDRSNHDHVPERRFRQPPPGRGGLHKDIGPEGRGLRGDRDPAHNSE